jgi:PAS domain-containing protein
VEDRATPLLHEDGRLAGYVGVVVDVGARREAEQADHDRNASWRLAIEAQQVALFEWNLETDVVLWSPRLHDVLGFDGFGASRPGAFRALAHPDDRMRLEHAVAEHLGADAALRLMLRLRLREGGFGPFIFAGLAERDECGRPCRLCGSLLELTNDLVSYAP